MADLAAQYDVESAVADFAQYMARYAAESEQARALFPGVLDIPYGPEPLQALDVYAPPGGDGAPVQIYIHGGAWRASDKGGRGYPAAAFVPHGAVWVPINYRLAPAAAIDRIVDDARDAVRWVFENAREFGGDPDRIFVSGNSAGGHLAAMLAAEGWHARHGVPDGVVKGATAISGIFDMRPLWRTGVYDWLALDENTATRNSPIDHIPAAGCPMIVAYGGAETDAFKDQSRTFAEAWRAAGNDAILLDLEGHNHFSVMAELARPAGTLVRTMLAQMGLVG